MLEMNTTQFSDLKAKITALAVIFPPDPTLKTCLDKATNAHELFTNLFTLYYADENDEKRSMRGAILSLAIDYLQNRSISDFRQILEIAHAAYTKNGAPFDIYEAIPASAKQVWIDPGAETQPLDEHDIHERTYKGSKFAIQVPMLRLAFNYFGQVIQRNEANWKLMMRNEGTLADTATSEGLKPNQFLVSPSIDLLLYTMFANDQEVAIVDPLYPIPDVGNKKLLISRTLDTSDARSRNELGYAMQELLKKAATQNPRIPIFIPLGLPGHVTFMVLDFAPDNNTINLHFKDSLGSPMPKDVKDFVTGCINDGGFSLGKFAEIADRTQTDYLTCPIHVVTSAVSLKTFLTDRAGKELDLSDQNYFPARNTSWCWGALKAMQNSLIEFANLGFSKMHCVLPPTPKPSPEPGPTILKASPPAPDSTNSAQPSRSLQVIFNKLEHWDKGIEVQTLKNSSNQIVNYLVKPAGVNDKQILNVAVNAEDQKITAITIDDPSHPAAKQTLTDIAQNDKQTNYLVSQCESVDDAKNIINAMGIDRLVFDDRVPNIKTLVESLQQEPGFTDIKSIKNLESAQTHPSSHPRGV